MSRKARIRNRRILIGFLVILIVIAVYSLAMNRGKDTLIRALEDHFGKQVTVSSLQIIPPFKVEIEDVEVEDFFTVKRIVASPSLVGMFLGRIAFNDLLLVEPKITVWRNENDVIGPFNLKKEDKVATVGVPETQENPAATKDNAPIAKKQPKKRLVIISNLNVEDGEINFIDYKVKKEGFSILLNDINVAATKVSLSALPSPINFTLRAFLSTSQEKRAMLDFSGWVNFFRKDMKGKIEIADLDLTYFSPYFKSLADFQLKSALLDVEADIESKSNDLTIASDVSFKDFVFKEPLEKEKDALNTVNNFIFTMLQAREGETQKIVLKGDFLPLKIKKFEFDINFAKDKIKSIFTSDNDDFIKKAKEVGKAFEDFGKQFKESFKKEKNEQLQDQAVSEEDSEASSSLE